MRGSGAAQAALCMPFTAQTALMSGGGDVSTVLSVQYRVGRQASVGSYVLLGATWRQVVLNGS